uniref:Haloacid dehalogenase-like hydrolase domain-containing protein 3 n=1 Tax=Aureoumbra lagunensis TaxID=44058 RepID=A0A7S3NPN6_9STRA|mmetsp:Transcript_12467/g.18705  ORF Transcript_12467/g.18705 Transcript_12467/m.18705 type:complete len:276 (-) Transcript_12467:120-947(-)
MKMKTAQRLMKTVSVIRAISFDITGTLIDHQESIAETYARCAQLTLTDPPSAEEMQPAFRRAFKEASKNEPYFGYPGNEREWWKYTVRLCLEYTGKIDINEDEFNRYFYRVYQHFGSPKGYTVLPQVRECLKFLSEKGLLLGVTSNTPHRTIDTTLPMLDLSKYFDFFVCTADLGAEKPEPEIFNRTLFEVQTLLNDFTIQPHQILHIGDSLVADYCGARAAGFSALYLNRGEKSITFQDWLVAPTYPGKSNEDIHEHTIHEISQVVSFFNHREK